MPRTAGQLLLFGVPRWQPAAAADASVLPDTLPGYLVAYLAYRGDWSAREALTGVFWPDRAEVEAQHNLRVNLHRAKTLLASWGMAEALEADRRRVRLHLPTDVADFRAALGAADWPAAVELHSSPLLSSLSFRGFTLLDEWVHTERRALHDAWRDASLKAALASEAAGDLEQAASRLLRQAQLEPPTEDGMQVLLRVAQAAGRRDEALAAFERFRAWLNDDLGLAPMAGTQALADALKTGQRAPRADAAPVAAEAGRVPRAVVQPPRVIGRDAELAAVADLSLPLVAVSGEPGVGKTRLLEEALPAARWIACREGLANVPFAPVIEYLSDFRDSLPVTGDERLDLARLLPDLAAGTPLPPPDPVLGKTRLLLALARVLETEAAALVFDDLQWADAATAELIAFLAQRRAVPLRLVHRSTETTPALEHLLASLQATGPLRHVALAPLSRDDLIALLALLSRAQAGPPLFATWLHQRTGGNPFFALQTLRALFESGRLTAGLQGWSSDLDAVTLDYSELQIPERVADLVRRRLRGLSDSARRVLSLAAILGDGREVERIAACIGLSPLATAEAIAEAEAGGLLRDGRFAHDVVRQSLAQALPNATARVMHAAVARQFADVLSGEALADHWWAAAQPGPAVEATVRAWTHQRDLGLHAQALSLLDHAARRLADVADADQRRQWLARIDVLRARSRLDGHDLDGADAHARRALDRAPLPPERAHALRILGTVAVHRGQLDQAGRWFDEAALVEPDDLELLVQRGQLAMMLGRPGEAIPSLERECARLRREPPGAKQVQVLTSLAALYNETGALDRGLPLIQEAHALAARLGLRHAQVEAAVNLVWALETVGREEEAIGVGREALALGEYESTPTLRNNIGWSLWHLGRLDEARVLYRQLEQSSDPTLALVARSKLVDIHVRLGEPAETQALLDRLFDTMGTTESSVAVTAAAAMILRHGDDALVRRALTLLPRAPLEPSQHETLRSLLTERGMDPSQVLATSGLH